MMFHILSCSLNMSMKFILVIIFKMPTAKSMTSKNEIVRHSEQKCGICDKKKLKLSLILNKEIVSFVCILII